jgi:hypothetical protein
MCINFLPRPKVICQFNPLQICPENNCPVIPPVTGFKIKQKFYLVKDAG